MMPRCQVRSENTQAFSNHPGRHADVLVTAPGRSPMVVEGEYEPAPEVQEDALDRLVEPSQGLFLSRRALIISGLPTLEEEVGPKMAVDRDQKYREMAARGKHQGLYTRLCGLQTQE